MSYPPIFSVSQLTFAIKQKLESSFRLVAVRGEVSNLRAQSSGHLYFTLKDKDSQIAAVLFKGSNTNLPRQPKEGDQIVVKGELSVYAPRGNYQIIVREIEFSGVGPLLQQLHELKIKLEKQGWFDPALKKPLPKFPKTIGVVTSSTGSVIQDILHILSRRFSGFHLILNPVRVQGEGAAGEIAQAIEEFNQHHLCDVLIVGRGGGSLEDLWPFNEEIVASAIHLSRIPIISAVGHETDFTIADFVADVRAPTPSAAAEIVTGEKNQHLLYLKKTEIRMIQSLQAHLRSSRRMLETLAKQPPLSSPYSLFSHFLQKMDDLRENITGAMYQTIDQSKFKLNWAIKQQQGAKPDNKINLLKQNFSKNRRDIQLAAALLISHKKQKLAGLTEHLQAIDPRNLLKKGYSILFHEKKDSVILSTSDVEIDEKLRVKLFDGQLLVTVQEKKS